MRHLLHFVNRTSYLVLLLGVLCQAQTPQSFSLAEPAAVGFSTERLQRLDAFLKRLIDEGKAPNAVTFVARRGKVVHFKAFGYRNLEKKEPLRKNDIFRIASQTKAITSVALMTLHEEGRFLLDDPISKYIPAFKNPRVFVRYDSATGRVETRPAKSEITIRQLLSHTAGIPYEHPLGGQPAYEVPFFASTKRETLADVIPKLAARPLMADPGEKYVYGLNTDILGYLIEVLSGKSLDVFIKQRVLDPLGMTETHFYLPQEKTGRLVQLYSKATPADRLTVHTNDTYRAFAVSGARTYFSGGAGLVSTIEDYAKFCQMMLNRGVFNGKRILSGKTVDMMTRNQIGELEVWDRQDKFGLGFQVITPNSHYGDQASVGAYTWGGMYCSEYTIDPAEQLVMLVFTNVQPYAHYSEFVRTFRTLVYQALP